jgi:hypothetical protein
MRLEPPFHGAIDEGDLPDEMRTPEELYWLEQAILERQERGELPASKPIEGEWSTVQEVAARHRLQPKTIRKYIHGGALKAIDISSSQDPRHRRYRIHRTDEEAWIAAKGQRTGSIRSRTNAKPAGRSFRDLVSK